MIDLTKTVKYSNPLVGEENLIFVVKNYNEVTERCYIECQNLKGFETGLKPQSLVSVSDLINL